MFISAVGATDLKNVTIAGKNFPALFELAEVGF